MNRVSRVGLLAVAWIACAAPTPGPPPEPWSATDQRALWALLALIERNSVSFSSHPELFMQALYEYRDRYAQELDATRRGLTPNFTTESAISPFPLPVSGVQTTSLR